MKENKDAEIIEKIKNKYEEKPKTESKLEGLKALDLKVRKPALIFAYIYGIVGTLVLGVGMSLAMKVIGNLMAFGIVVGVLGIAMVSTTYPIYQTILKRRKANFRDEILSKSNELLGNK